MECRECGKAVDRDKVGISILGSVLFRPCREEFHQKRQQRQAELRVEPLLQTPAELTVSDFEAFSLKVAVYASLNLDSVQDLPEGLREPDILVLQVKEVLLAHLPEEYVQVWVEGSGWSRKSRYSFRKPLPAELLRTAMRDAGFEWRVAWFGNATAHAFAATELGALFNAVRQQVLRAIDETERGRQSTASDRAAPVAFDSLLKYVLQLDEQWRFHHDPATASLSKATQMRPRDAIEVLDRLERPLHVLALGPANAA